MPFIHQNLASGKWKKLSFSEQLANIGSEVNRIVSFAKKGDAENKEKSFQAVLELIDLTISDKRWQGRLLEILRLREVLCDLFSGKNVYKTELENIQNYFLFFGIKALNKK